MRKAKSLDDELSACLVSFFNNESWCKLGNLLVDDLVANRTELDRNEHCNCQCGSPIT